jgi:hypothetical protein
MICRQCGSNNWDQATICGACGARLFAAPAPTAWQPPNAAAYQGQYVTSYVQRVAEPLYRAKGWMKFIGVLTIIYGGLLVLSLSGIILAWLPIWLGIVLCSASSKIGLAFETDNENEFHASLKNLATYFRVAGIATLVIIILGVIALLGAIAYWSTQRR